MNKSLSELTCCLNQLKAQVTETVVLRDQTFNGTITFNGGAAFNGTTTFTTPTYFDDDVVVASTVIATGYVVGANQVVGARGAAVANATDAASVIARLNDLLARLRTHGLIA